MPDYHRLDLGATWESKATKRFQSSWTFGVYNVSNRKNAYIIDFRESEANPNITEAYRIALFGIIQSITWNFNFRSEERRVGKGCVGPFRTRWWPVKYQNQADDKESIKKQ